MGEWLAFPSGIVRRHLGEDLLPVMETAIIDRLAGGCEYRPEARSLLRSNSVLAPEARHVGISVRAVELPGIDYVGPLREQKARGELGDTKVRRGFGQRIAYEL